MFKFKLNKLCLLLLIIQVNLNCLKAQVALYGQCGGIGYSGKVNCDSGLSCYVQNTYYSQCLTSCPTGWQCHQCKFIFIIMLEKVLFFSNNIISFIKHNINQAKYNKNKSDFKKITSSIY